MPPSPLLYLPTTSAPFGTSPRNVYAYMLDCFPWPACQRHCFGGLQAKHFHQSAQSLPAHPSPCTPTPPPLQVQRADDTEGTVRQRLTNYKLHCQVVKSAPGLVAHLVEVDGDRPEEAVAEDIHAALAAARSAAGAATQAAGGSWAAVGSG